MALFSGEVCNGLVELDDRQQFRAFLSTLEGKRINVEVEEQGAACTDGQHRYFRGMVCKQLSDYTGYEMEWWAEFFKGMFLTVEHDDGSVEVLSTATLSRKAFAEFTDKCIRWALLEFKGFTFKERPKLPAERGRSIAAA